MQGLRLCSKDVVSLELSPPNTVNSSPLSIDGGESTETRIHRLISEHPVIIFSRSSCCMCHSMKKLLAAVGVHPTVIELDDHEISALPPPPPPPHSSRKDGGNTPRNLAPAVFIGGTCVGGLDSLVALHISGLLVPRLVEVGALKDGMKHLCKAVVMAWLQLQPPDSLMLPLPFYWWQTCNGDDTPPQLDPIQNVAYNVGIT